jgi:hypothetical protein
MSNIVKNENHVKAFILKKDLPTIKAGRVIKLSKDMKTGSPILMSIEEKNSVNYVFTIDVLKNEKDWFEIFDYDRDSFFSTL